MGKITDAVLALIVLIIGMYVLTKLGLTAGAIWSMFKSFFSNPSTAGNSTAGVLFGIVTNSEARKKRMERLEEIRRNRVVKFLCNIPLFKGRRGEY